MAKRLHPTPTHPSDDPLAEYLTQVDIVRKETQRGNSALHRMMQLTRIVHEAALADPELCEQVERELEPERKRSKPNADLLLLLIKRWVPPVNDTKEAINAANQTASRYREVLLHSIETGVPARQVSTALQAEGGCDRWLRDRRAIRRAEKGAPPPPKAGPKVEWAQELLETIPHTAPEDEPLTAKLVLRKGVWTIIDLG